MDVSKKYSLQVFEGQMKIKTSSYPETFTTKTDCFSPLPDESIAFYFELRHSKIKSPAYGEYPESKFELKLVRQPSTKVYNLSLVISVEVKISLSDGSILKNYKPLSITEVDQMNFVSFSANSFKMIRGPLTLTFKMIFNNYIPRPIHPSSFSGNLRSIYESGVFHDFVFNVGDKSFPVHKALLVAHSPVFMKMLTEDYLESKTNCVTITDSTPENFDLFLRYLYSGEIFNKSWPFVKELYGLANKYDVAILKKDCVDITISLMSEELVCEILKTAYAYDDSNLKSAAKQFAVDHIKELISREDWKLLVAMQPIIGYEVIVNFVPT